MEKLKLTERFFKTFFRKKAKRVLAVILTVLMVNFSIGYGGIISVYAQSQSGTTYDISKGAITINSSNLSTYNNAVITGASDSNMINIDGVTANLTLSGMNLNIKNVDDTIARWHSAIKLTNGATLNLTIIGDNTVTGGDNHAAINVPEGCSLMVTQDSTGTLTATAGSGSAGIGADYGGTGDYSIQTVGNVTIDGGTVKAYGSGGGAGIGGTSYGKTGNIVINGGTVYAKGGGGFLTNPFRQAVCGAGIGGGNCGYVQNITITGGNVAASGGHRHENFAGFKDYPAAGIGCGSQAGITLDGKYTCGTISITGGTVSAIGGNNNAVNAIGYGLSPDFDISGNNYTGSVTISDNASVNTNGGAIHPLSNTVKSNMYKLDMTIYDVRLTKTIEEATIEVNGKTYLGGIKVNENYVGTISRSLLYNGVLTGEQTVEISAGGYSWNKTVNFTENNFDYNLMWENAKKYNLNFTIYDGRMTKGTYPANITIDGKTYTKDITVSEDYVGTASCSVHLPLGTAPKDIQIAAPTYTWNTTLTPSGDGGDTAVILGTKLYPVYLLFYDNAITSNIENVSLYVTQEGKLLNSDASKGMVQLLCDGTISMEANGFGKMTAYMPVGISTALTAKVNSLNSGADMTISSQSVKASSEGTRITLLDNIPQISVPLDLSKGSIKFVDDGNGMMNVTYITETGEVTVLKQYYQNEYEIIQSNSMFIETTNQIIFQNTTDFVNVKLNGVNMKSTGKAIDLQNSKAKLNLSGTNTIDCGGGSSGYASYYIGIHAAYGSELTIDGSGSLEVKNPSYYGVGIGAYYSGKDNISEGTGTIRIQGGNLNVSGVQGAAIGSCYYYQGNDFGSIYIAGGTVNASSNKEGAAIGGSSSGKPANVYITGGKVTAKTKDIYAGACIGSGCDGMFGGEVCISGGYVEAQATGLGATAIGGGYRGVCPNITVSGGTIKATGVVASIGTAGKPRSGGSLKITGGSICAINNNKPTINLTPTKDGNTPVYYTTVNVDEIYGKDASVNDASITGCDYGFTDVKTDANGVLHLYLPASAADTKTEASFSNVNYSGKITSGDSNVLKTPAVFTAEANTITGTGASLHAAYENSGIVYYVANSTELTTGSEVENASGVQSMTMSDGVTSTILSGLKEETEYTYYLVVKIGDIYSNVVSVTFTTLQKSPLSGTGTQTDPYIIETADDLSYLANTVRAGQNYSGKYFKLNNDITYSSVPIGCYIEGSSTNSPFCGNFDGAGHTVTLAMTNASSGMNEAVALFGYLGSGASVKNISTTGTITSSGKFSGGIAGVARDGAVNISNCWSNVEMDSTTGGDSTYGGIVGLINNSGNVTMTNCRFTGKITSSGSSLEGVGGLCGWKDSASTLNAVNCYVDASFGSEDLIAKGKYMARNGGTFTNCYYNKEKTLTDDGSTSSTGNEAVTNDFTSGKIAWLLQNGQSNPAVHVWGQTLTGDIVHSNPILSSDSEKAVHKVSYYEDNKELENSSSYVNRSMTLPAFTLTDEEKNQGYRYSFEITSGNATLDTANNQLKDIGGDVTVTVKKVILYTINTQTKNTNLGTVGEGGIYVAGAEITLIAKPRMGCKFVKWSSDADGNTEVSTERNLTVTVSSSSTYYAWFAKDKYMITVGDFNHDAGTVSGVKEEGYSYNEEAALIAEAKTAYAFEGWKNEYCVTVTTSSAISFEVSGNMTITPIFRQINESTTYCAISFYHQSGNLLKSEMVEANSTITFIPPTTPSKIGYDFVGWSTDGINPVELNEDGSITITSDMIFKPQFKAKEETFSLTVNGTEIAYKPLSSVTAQVAEADIPEGKQFAYWKDGDGKITSYSNPYKFTITGNIELTAEYEDSIKDVIKKPTLTLSAPTYEFVSTGKHKMIWYVAMDLPEGYTLVESGILRVVSTTPQTAEQMIFDSEGIYRRIIQVSSSIANQYYYSVTASDGKGVSVRAYIVVKNKDGNLETIFSDVQYACYSGN